MSRRAPPALLTGYIARLIFPPLAATLAISAVVLLLIRMTDLVSFVLDRGGDVSRMLQMVGNLMPQYLAFGVPVGLLLGVWQAFDRLSANGELDAIWSAGIAHGQLLRAPLLCACVLAAITFLLVGVLQPLSAYQFEKLRYDLSSGRDVVAPLSGKFEALNGDVTVRVAQSAHGGRDLAGVFVSSRNGDGSLDVIFAAHAVVEAGQGAAKSVATLYDGRITHLQPATGDTRTLAFESYTLRDALPVPPTFRVRGINERERTIFEQVGRMMNPGMARPQQNEAAAGVVRRLTQVAVLFFIPLLAVAAAKAPLRGRREWRGLCALSLFIVYNEVSLYGERLGLDGLWLSIPVQLAAFVGFGGVAAGAFVFAFHRHARGVERSGAGIAGPAAPHGQPV